VYLIQQAAISDDDWSYRTKARGVVERQRQGFSWQKEEAHNNKGTERKEEETGQGEKGSFRKTKH